MIHPNFQSLATTLSGYENKIHNGVATKIKATAKLAGVNVIKATPEDTSRAKFGWQTTIDNLPGKTNIGKRELQIQAGNIGESDAIQRVKDVVKTFRSKQNQRIYISNYLDYVQELNRGWSPKAPTNYIQGVVVAAVASTRYIKILEDSVEVRGS